MILINGQQMTFIVKNYANLIINRNFMYRKFEIIVLRFWDILFKESDKCITIF